MKRFYTISAKMKTTLKPALLLCLLAFLGFKSIAQPANDDPCNAIAILPAASCSFQTYTTAGATASPGIPAPGCANYAGSDVWFKVMVPAGGALTVNTLEGSINDGGMAMYSGSCGNLTLLTCDDDGSTPTGLMPMISRGGLTPGSTIWIRFWEYGGNNNGTFGICVTLPQPPPSNDDCAQAVHLTVNPGMGCVASANGTTMAATASAAPAPGCGAWGTDDDVWYSFTASGSKHMVTVSNVSGQTSDMAMAVYGGTCGNLTLLQCSDPNSMTVNNLVAGQTYFIRVWTTVSGTAGANFRICVGVPPPPPVNDDPCNAINLTVAESGNCSYQLFSNIAATASAGVPAPGCAMYVGADVWFKLTVPCSGSIVIDTQEGEITDGGMAIYSGTCNNLALLACDDDNSANGFMPSIKKTGLVPGSTLWIRFWDYKNENNGTFGICAQVPAPVPPAATCETAQSFCTSIVPTTVPNITGQDDAGSFGCLSTTPNPTFYYLQIANPGNISITISQTSAAGDPLDVDYLVWGPFNNLSTACNTLSTANIVDCSYSPAAVEVATIPNAQAGEYYLFLVTNFSDVAGTITYQQTGGNGSSNCGIVCSLNAGNSGPVCASAPFDLTASAVANATYSWTGPNCFSASQQNPGGIIAPATPGQYVYTATAKGINNTVCSDTTILTVVARPVLAADTSISVCAGTTIDLTALYNTTGLSPVWTRNGIAVNNPAGVNASGTYRLVAANSTGCSDTAFVKATIDTVRADFSSAQIQCVQSGRISINTTSGIAPYLYSINTSQGLYQQVNTFVTGAGNYNVTVKDSLGCTTTSPVNVAIAPPFKVDAGTDMVIVAGDQVQLAGTSSEPAASVSWTPAAGLAFANSLAVTAKPAASTTYILNATNTKGCAAIDNVQVTVIPYCIKIKNAFTPNGDGNNDLWQVYNQFDCLKNVSLQVFNRYGNKVFESRDYRNTWNGTYKGQPVPDGTYYAVVNFTLINGKLVTLRSDVTILR